MFHFTHAGDPLDEESYPFALVDWDFGPGQEFIVTAPKSIYDAFDELM